jgi:long-chain fatty acid transport protein
MKTNLTIGEMRNRNPLRELFQRAGCGIGIALFCAALFDAPEAGAVAFRLPNQDPEAIARGNAFAATADNPSAIYYNPAGITQLEGQNFSAGIYLISAGDTFEGSGSASAKTKSEFQPVPQFYYVNAPKDFPLAFGVGVYVPYGLSLDWGNDNPFRKVTQNGAMLYATVNPVVAWKITPELSVAIGPTINYSKVDFNQGVAAPNDQFHFVGDDYNFGFTAGARWQPIDMLAFGVNYRYSGPMDYKGHTTYTSTLATFSDVHTTGSLNFPQNVVGGISFRPTPNWNIEFDLDWTDWHVVKQAVFQNTALGPMITLPLNYQSSFMYEFGVTRKLPKNYFVSAGYIYSENSSPNQFFDPLVPDSNLHLGNVGFGHKGQKWNWAISYTAAINPGRHVAGDSFDKGTPGTMVDGTYRTINHAINISTCYKF